MHGAVYDVPLALDDTGPNRHHLCGIREIQRDVLTHQRSGTSGHHELTTVARLDVRMLQDLQRARLRLGKCEPLMVSSSRHVISVRDERVAFPMRAPAPGKCLRDATARRDVSYESKPGAKWARCPLVKMSQ